MRIVLALLLAMAAAPAQEFRFHPQAVKQGDLLQVTSSGEATQVRLNGKTVPLYRDESGSSFLALMPIPVLMPPGAYRLEWLDSKGSVRHASDIRVADAHYPVQNVVLSKALTELRSTVDERDEVSAFMKDDSAVRYWTFPIHAPLTGCLTSLFGVQRLHNGKATGDFHAGLDQRGATGTPIHAAAAGDVKLAGQFAVHGGTVGIDHGQGLKTMYLHMSRIAVTTGEHVSVDQIIGYVGSTGRSTGSHLHWSVYAHGEPMNPLQWVALQPCGGKAVVTPKRRRRT